MNWQYIVVGLIFIAAIYYVVSSMRKSSKGNSCCGNDCAAHPQPNKK